MIISCEKCNKKFEISNSLIPDDGRLLQCGSCSHKWHYIPATTVKLTNEIESDESTAKPRKISQKQNIKKKTKNKKDVNDDLFETSKDSVKDKKGIGFLSYVMVIIISFITLIVLVDTFKSFLTLFIPGIDFYLSSLYESLKDIFLFLKDLLK